MKQILHGVGCSIVASQKCRLVGIHGQCLLALGIFLVAGEEALDIGAAAAAVDPLVVRAEAEFPVCLVLGYLCYQADYLIRIYAVNEWADFFCCCSCNDIFPIPALYDYQ